MDNNDFTIIDLLESAKKDESWEPDPKVREELITLMTMTLAR